MHQAVLNVPFPAFVLPTEGGRIPGVVCRWGLGHNDGGGNGLDAGQRGGLTGGRDSR